MAQLAGKWKILPGKLEFHGLNVVTGIPRQQND